jgi:4-carboxymuconolactone decarboxylase
MTRHSARRPDDRAALQQKGATAQPAAGSVAAVLDAPTSGLVRVALGIPHASEAQLAEWMAAAAAAGTPALWMEELLISSLLYVGFPRALVAMTVWRRREPQPAPGAEASDYAGWRAWVARGEATCREVYGPHYEQLRHNVRALHPALELWMMVDGYGKTLSRPGLDLRRRELCSVALLVPQSAPRQLVAHLRGALNAGATPQELDDVLALAAEAPGSEGLRDVALGLWHELRDNLRHD